MNYFPKTLKSFTLILHLVLICTITTAKAQTFPINQTKSKLTYTLTQFGFPFKRKSLPVNGEASIERNKKTFCLKSLALKAHFISKNKIFLRTIDFDHYPYLSFSTKTNDLILPEKRCTTTIPGYLTFHGTSQFIEPIFKYRITKNTLFLTSYIKIRMTDFGIIPPKFLFFPVDNTIKTKAEIAIPINSVTSSD